MGCPGLEGAQGGMGRKDSTALGREAELRGLVTGEELQPARGWKGGGNLRRWELLPGP